MGLRDVLGQVMAALDDEGVPYMLTGSLAAAYYAIPRATQDIDLVVAAPVDQLLRLAKALGQLGYYVSPEAVEEAVQFEGQFNAIDPTTGWKVDFILRKDRPFSESEFGRRVTADVLGVAVSIVSAEDLLVAKLEWSRKGGSERQQRDAAAILRVQGKALDLAYLNRWVSELGLEEEWRLVREAAGNDPDGPSA